MWHGRLTINNAYMIGGLEDRCFEPPSECSSRVTIYP